MVDEYDQDAYNANVTAAREVQKNMREFTLRSKTIVHRALKLGGCELADYRIDDALTSLMALAYLDGEKVGLQYAIDATSGNLK